MIASSPFDFFASRLSALGHLCALCTLIHLFVFGVYRRTREFFTHMETLPFPVKGCKFFYLCSALMAIEQWGFFSVPHLLWHGASVYNLVVQNRVCCPMLCCFLVVPICRPLILPYSSAALRALQYRSVHCEMKIKYQWK